MEYREFYELARENKLSGAYILHGDEEYTKGKAVEALLELIEPAFRSMNVQEYSAYSAEEVMAACSTYPFLAQRRLILVRGLPDASDAEALLGALDDIPQTTVLAFVVSGKFDEKKRPARKSASVKSRQTKGESFFAAMSELGRVCEFSRLSEGDIVKWVIKECKLLGRGISRQDALMLVRRVGDNLMNVRNELYKVAFYVPEGGVIDAGAIAECVTANIEYRVFDMLDYFVAGKAADGYRALDALLENGSDAMGVAMYLSRQFRLMLRAKLLIDEGCDRRRAVERLGGNAYATGKAYDAARTFSTAGLTAAAADFANLPYLQISGFGRIDELIVQTVSKHLIKGERGNG
ncbi:MAG: DNA polymerase III subunit delta [Clostridia bacterium]|nr:DNA polymerase III subunit delta [Clostridia bacterium]